MGNDILASSQQSLRGTDSNSLLRLYDMIRGLAQTSPSQYERGRADRAMQRVTKELERRKVAFTR